MNYFHYTGKDSNGITVKGWLLAEARDAAVDILQERKIQPFVVKEGQESISLQVPEEELLATLRELASLRGSGMALDKSVAAVAKSAEHRQLIRSWSGVGRMVSSGLSLSEAFAAHPESFPRFVIPLVRLGEANGKLQSSLTAAADRFEEEIQLRTEIKTALTYPAFLVVISVAVLLFLFLGVIPKFGSMVGDMGGVDSQLLVLVTVAEVMKEYLWLWGAIAVGLGVAAVHAWRNGTLQSKLWQVMQRMPGVRGLLEAWEITQFCGSMRRLLPEGVGLLEAVQLSSETLAREDVRRRLNLTVESMRQGEGFAESLKKHKLFSPLTVQMIEVGEAAANLPVSMEEIAKLYSRRLSEGIRRLLSLLEPAVIVSMGLIVGGIMVSLLSAVMSMNDMPL